MRTRTKHFSFFFYQILYTYSFQVILLYFISIVLLCRKFIEIHETNLAKNGIWSQYVTKTKKNHFYHQSFTCYSHIQLTIYFGCLFICHNSNYISIKHNYHFLRMKNTWFSYLILLTKNQRVYDGCRILVKKCIYS